MSPKKSPRRFGGTAGASDGRLSSTYYLDAKFADANRGPTPTPYDDDGSMAIRKHEMTHQGSAEIMTLKTPEPRRRAPSFSGQDSEASPAAAAPRRVSTVGEVIEKPVAAVEAPSFAREEAALAEASEVAQVARVALMEGRARASELAERVEAEGGAGKPKGGAPAELIAESDEATARCENVLQPAAVAAEAAEDKAKEALKACRLMHARMVQASRLAEQTAYFNSRHFVSLQETAADLKSQGEM